MRRPNATGGDETPVLHFTHIENLATIARHGLQCDSDVQTTGRLKHEIGHRDIKRQRRERAVPVPPGGVVGDYVPFYFAPRSPMMYSIHMGNVPTYHEGCDDVVYLCSTLGRLQASGSTVVLTDRNAALGHARFAQAADDLDIDWPLMRERYWPDTAEYPDRRERRMAECLVHRLVEPTGIAGVVAKTEVVARRVTRLVGTAWPVTVRPDWYF